MDEDGSGRREAMGAALAAMVAVGLSGAAGAVPARIRPDGVRRRDAMTSAERPTYGVIGQIKARPGQREALLAALTEGSRNMAGNHGYIIGTDLADPDGIWITELWSDKAAHDASLELPRVKAAIARARPLIAGFGTRAEFRPG